MSSADHSALHLYWPASLETKLNAYISNRVLVESTTVVVNLFVNDKAGTCDSELLECLVFVDVDTL